MPTCCSMKIPLESVVATEPTLRITQLEQGIQAMVSTPEAGQPALTENHEPKQANWVAAGALIGAGLASACCVVPLLLVMLGISGAWIANLTALEPRSEEHTSELQSLMRISYAVFCLKKKNRTNR